MKRLFVLLFLFAVVVSPMFDSNGGVVCLLINVDVPSLGIMPITFKVTNADIPLLLSAEGDLRNKTEIKVVAKQKFLEAKAARIAEINAVAAQAAFEETVRKKISLPISDSDFN